MKNRIYISGKITGLDPKRAWMNFLKVEIDYTRLGIPVVNPMSKRYFFNRMGKLPWIVYIFFDIILLLGCRGIYLQQNWEESKGARIEYRIARFLKFTIIYGK